MKNNTGKNPNNTGILIRKLLWLYLVCVALWLAGALLRWLGSDPPRQFPSHSRLVSILHSKRPYGEAEIPFQDHYGQILVQASFAGKPVECLVDTGVRDIVWQNLNLPCRQSYQWFTYPHPFGVHIPAEFVTLSSIRLGDYELPNVATVYLSTNQPALVRTPDNRPIQAILGNYAFKSIVLTVDYQRKVLILRRPDFDITRQPRSPQDCLLDFTPEGSHIEYSPEYLQLQGRIEGHPVAFVLDTGHCMPGILIAPAFRNQLASVPPGKPPSWRYSLFDQSVREVTRPLKWSMGNLEGECAGHVISMRSGWQVVIGYAVLKKYRLTIDYPHRKILLQPYQNDAN